MKKILFMCVANSARSQLAEGLAKSVLGQNAEIQSAGSRPSKVNPYAIEVLKEIGIDITSHWSKTVDQLTAEFVSSLDLVITLCAEEVCPLIISKAERLHWPLPDPSSMELDAINQQLDAFRATRDEIERRLLELEKRLFGTTQ